MRITDLQVDGFGIWNELSVDQLSDKMTVFFGRNEAGKTTLLEFIRTVLYGFSADRRQRYLPPVRGRLAGGSVYVAGRHGNLEIQRHVDPRDGKLGLGEVALTDPAGNTKGQAHLDRVLTGMDEATFNNVFAIGLRELQELATLDDTEAAAQLYRLSSGLDRVSLVDVMRHLRDSQIKLLGDDEQPSEIAQLFAQQEKLAREIEQLAARGNRWSTIAGQCATLQNEVAGLEQYIRKTETEARVVEVAIQAITPWRERAEIDAQLDALGPLGKLGDEALEQLEDLNAKITERQQQRDQLAAQQIRVRQHAQSLPINRLLWSQRCRIDAVCEHASWIDSLESQIGRLESDVVSVRSELESQCAPLGLQVESLQQNLPDISDHTLKVLRGPARALRLEHKRRSLARKHHDTDHKNAQQLQQQVEAELAQRGQRNLNESLESVGQRVSQLRRRIQLDERIDKMEKSRDELREDIDELLEEQILPGWKLLVCGIPFVLGIALIMVGIFLPKIMAVGWAIALLGFAGVAVAVVMKILLERNASRELEDNNERLERLGTQLKQARAERSQLDEELPIGGGALDVRLAAAEKELADLEQLLPLDAELQESRRRSEAARLRISQASNGVKEAHNRWIAALRAVGLPTDLTPKRVSETTRQCDQITQQYRRYLDRKDELELRQHELVKLTDRVQRLCAEVRIGAGDEKPQILLRLLSSALAEQKQLIERRGELHREYQSLKRDHRRYSRNVVKLSDQRRAILAEANVVDEADLHRLVEKQSHIRLLRGKRQELTQQINAILGAKFSEDLVAEQFAAYRNSELEQRSADLLASVEGGKVKLTKLFERRGQFTQELKTLAEDRRWDEAKLEQGCVTKRLGDAVERSQTIAVTSAVLESIREIYEAERQPETLNEASRYLAQLTGGNYQRVWTPLGEDVLRVDDTDGQCLPVEMLSCGTREAVFLSLRLALAAAYARRGAVLPLVLDDVLVNFDVERAGGAAKLLRDFANAGHQVLLFTCHDHIVEIFQNLKVEVRKLPHHARSGVPVEVEDEPEEEFIEVSLTAEDFEGVQELAREHDDTAEYDDDVDNWNEDATDEKEEATRIEDERDKEPAFTWESADSLWEDDADEAA